MGDHFSDQDISDCAYFNDGGCRISTNIYPMNIHSDERVVLPKLLEAHFDIVVSTEI